MRSYGRRLSISLAELSDLLTGIFKQNEDIRRFLEVITIVSPEFRDLIRQSIRNIGSCINTSITFDAATATVNVGSCLGLIKKFPIDVDVLVENPQKLDRSGQVEVPYAEAVLIILGACVKSLFLKTSVDSAPLCQEVLWSAESSKVAFRLPDSIVA